MITTERWGDAVVLALYGYLGVLLEEIVQAQLDTL